jgi:outer membrane protein assembly factor BamB
MCVMAGCAPGGGIWSTAAVDSSGNAFVGVGNPVDGVLAFDALTGERRWERSLYADDNRDLDVGASPVVFQLGGQEVVAQASVSGLFAVLRAGDGSELWRRIVVQGTAVHGLLASPGYDGIRVYVASASPTTGIHALQPRDGTEAWVHETALPVYSAPALGDGVVAFGTGAVLEDTKAGSLVVLSTTDGRALFTFDTHAAVRSGPAIAGRLIVVGDVAGALLAFRPR